MYLVNVLMENQYKMEDRVSEQSEHRFKFYSILQFFCNRHSAVYIYVCYVINKMRNSSNSIVQY